MEREEYPSSDKRYSGKTVSNQIQSTKLPTLTSANKVDSELLVLQGIHKVCKRLAWWSALPVEAEHLCTFTLFYDLFYSTAAFLPNEDSNLKRQTLTLYFINL